MDGHSVRGEMSKDSETLAVSSPRDLQPSAPFGADGPATDGRPASGMSVARRATDRGPDGKFVLRNTAAVNVGNRRARFIVEHEAAIRETRDAIVSDAGETWGTAPKALQLASESAAQAVIIQQSAFARMVESGGPLTSAGRTRRAFAIWLQATDRLEKHLRLIGLRRQPRPTANIAEQFAQLHDEDQR